MSIDFSDDEQPNPDGGLHPFADFVLGSGHEMSGISVFDQSRVLAALEHCELDGDAVKTLPTPGLLLSSSAVTADA